MRINVKILSIIIAVLILAAVTSNSQPNGIDPNVRDTIIISSSSTFSANSGSVPVYFFNDEPLVGIEMTLTYNSPDILVDSFSFIGSRLEAYSLKDADQISTNSITIYAFALDENLVGTGDGLLGTLYLSFVPNISSQTVNIDTLTITISDREFSTAFSDENANAFTPVVIPGALTIEPGGCCLGDRGNVDNSPDDVLDIGDLVYLVNYMFNSGPAPFCSAESNVDASTDDQTDISDLVYIVNYMFSSGPPPLSCP